MCDNSFKDSKIEQVNITNHPDKEPAKAEPYTVNINVYGGTCTFYIREQGPPQQEPDHSPSVDDLVDD